MFGSVNDAMNPPLPPSLVGLDLRQRYRVPPYRVSARHLLSLWTTSPDARALGMSFTSTIGLPTCVKSSCLKGARLAVAGRRSAVFGPELSDVDMGIWCGYTSRPHTVIVLLM
jgi:hypothetical protein